MKINVNHPSFLGFLDTVSNSILSNINAENYFSLPQDSKMAVLYMVFRLMKGSIKMKAVLGDNEMKAFIGVLWKKNEALENYEFAAILKDIMNNYDAINEFTKINKRTARVVKVDKTNNA